MIKIKVDSSIYQSVWSAIVTVPETNIQFLPELIKNEAAKIYPVTFLPNQELIWTVIGAHKMESRLICLVSIPNINNEVPLLHAGVRRFLSQRKRLINENSPWVFIVLMPKYAELLRFNVQESVCDFFDLSQQSEIIRMIGWFDGIPTNHCNVLITNEVKLNSSQSFGNFIESANKYSQIELKPWHCNEIGSWPQKGRTSKFGLLLPIFICLIAILCLFGRNIIDKSSSVNNERCQLLELERGLGTIQQFNTELVSLEQQTAKRSAQIPIGIYSLFASLIDAFDSQDKIIAFHFEDRTKQITMTCISADAISLMNRIQKLGLFSKIQGSSIIPDSSNSKLSRFTLSGGISQ